MADTVTESFCERCGTRYTFDAPSSPGPIRKTRGFVLGLRNYIMSQDSMSDAMSDAMRSEEERLAARQIASFHDTFNFCIDCRQYACLTCWNDGIGRCRSCAPIAGKDDLVERLEAAGGARREPLDAAGALAAAAAPGPETWPRKDLVVADLAAATATEDAVGEALPAEPAPEPVAAAAPEAPAVPSWQEDAPAFVPALAWQEDTAFELHPVAEAQEQPAWVGVADEPVLAIREASLAPDLAVLEPEPAAIASGEPAAIASGEPAAPATEEPALEPAAAAPVAAEAEAEAEPEVEVEAEPTVPEPPAPRKPGRRLLPELVPFPTESLTRLPRAAPPAAEPAEVPEPEPLAAVDASPEAAARRAQLESLGIGDPGQAPIAQSRGQVVPYRSSGAPVRATESLVASAALKSGSVWDASARQVAGTGAVPIQNCGRCGLSLSASARFCRRCGTRQARSA